MILQVARLTFAANLPGSDISVFRQRGPKVLGFRV